MATLVLAAVGTALGGPVGGALGAALGQAADSRLFAPKARQGPRLSDLAVQGSSYGAPLPRLFGRTRVAGSVIWATDLKETRERVSQGKGRSKVDQYSYSASFAVALSARPVLRVERIWADGALLRGAAGDWKHHAVMRLHPGDEDQAADPLIASAEGLAEAVAHRGLAYAVFENLPLAPWGNRIPLLSFEVIADEGPVSAGAVLRGLGAPVRDDGPSFDGFAATAGSIGETASAVRAIAPFAVLADGGLRFDPPAAAPTISTEEPVERGGRASRGATSELAASLTLLHADGARDYQAGQQSARRLSGGGRDEVREVPAVLAGGAARALAENALARIWRERARLELSLPWRWLATRPGDRVMLDGTRWQVETARIEGMAVHLSLVQAGGAVLPAGSSDGGRATREADLAAGDTVLAVLDLPPLEAGPVEGARLAVAANGTGGGWRRATLTASRDGGASVETLGATARPATMGRAVNVLGEGGALLLDRINSVEVELAHPALMLTDADADALAAGANMAMLGQECLQFGRATPLGAGRWRLRELWRGRRGTEDAIGGHAVGDAFVLLASETLFAVPDAFAVAGLRVSATGAAGGVASAAGPPTIGRAALPLSPIGLRCERASDGGARLSWTRRSRDGWAWRDGVDAPLAEEREAYAVALSLDGDAWSLETGEASATLTADRLAGGGRLTVSVRQIGRAGLSAALDGSFDWEG